MIFLTLVAVGVVIHSVLIRSKLVALEERIQKMEAEGIRLRQALSKAKAWS